MFIIILLWFILNGSPNAEDDNQLCFPLVVCKYIKQYKKYLYLNRYRLARDIQENVGFSEITNYYKL